jgi:hypothetical protein
MKTSNFEHLIQLYVARETPRGQTTKIETMLEVIKEKDIHWLSDETEELLFRKIKDSKIAPAEIGRFVKGLSKLRVSNLKWMKFKGMYIYFSEEAY